MKNHLPLLILLISTFTFSQDYRFGKVSKNELSEQAYPLDASASAAYLYNHQRSYYTYKPEDGFKIVTEVHLRIKIYNQEGLKHATQNIYYQKNEDEIIRSIKAVAYSLKKGKVVKRKFKKLKPQDNAINQKWNYKNFTLPGITSGMVFEIKYTRISPFWKITDLQFQYGIPVKKLAFNTEIPSYFKFNKIPKGHYQITPKLSTKQGSFNWSIVHKTTTSGGRIGEVPKRETERISINYFSENTLYTAKNIPALSKSEPFAYNINRFRGRVRYQLIDLDFPQEFQKEKEERGLDVVEGNFYEGTNFDRRFKNSELYNDFSEAWEDIVDDQFGDEVMGSKHAKSWENISTEIYKSRSFGNELKKVDYFKHELPRILNGLDTEIAKIKALLAHVKSKVKWNSVYSKHTQKGVEKAYESGWGNVAEINLILVAMLRESGLNAHPLLLSTKGNATATYDTSTNLNYVIASVTLGTGEQINLDAAEPFSAPNLIGVRTHNLAGIVVKPNGEGAIINPTSLNNTEANTLLIHVLEDGQITGNLRQRQTQLNALQYRKDNHNLSLEARVTNLEKAYSVNVSDLKILNEQELDKPIGTQFSFKTDQFTTTENNTLQLQPLLFLANTNNPFKAEERKFSVDFSAPWKNKNTVSIQIPKGYEVSALPKNISTEMTDKIGVFKYLVKHTGNTITIISITQFNKAVIAPSYYPELKAFYDTITKKQAEKIVLVKK